jgi:hypothetical protein
MKILLIMAIIELAVVGLVSYRRVWLKVKFHLNLEEDVTKGNYQTTLVDLVLKIHQTSMT